MTDKIVTIEGAIELHLHLAPNHSLAQFGDRMIIDPQPKAAPVAIKLKEAGDIMYAVLSQCPNLTPRERGVVDDYGAAMSEYEEFHDKLTEKFNDK